MKTIIYYVLPALGLTTAGLGVAWHQVTRALRLREVRKASLAVQAAREDGEIVAVATLVEQNRQAAELLQRLVEEASRDPMVDLQIGDLDDRAQALLTEMRGFDPRIDRTITGAAEQQQRRLQGGL